jgi:hypothetical protein
MLMHHRELSSNNLESNSVAGMQPPKLAATRCIGDILGIEAGSRSKRKEAIRWFVGSQYQTQPKWYSLM